MLKLTESELTRLIKKVIKENEFDCEGIINKMKYIFNSYMKDYNRYSGEENFDVRGLYYDLLADLGDLVDLAYAEDCEISHEIESIAYIFSRKFRMTTKTDLDDEF